MIMGGVWYFMELPVFICLIKLFWVWTFCSMEFIMLYLPGCCWSLVLSCIVWPWWGRWRRTIRMLQLLSTTCLSLYGILALSSSSFLMPITDFCTDFFYFYLFLLHLMLYLSFLLNKRKLRPKNIEMIPWANLLFPSIRTNKMGKKRYKIKLLIINNRRIPFYWHWGKSFNKNTSFPPQSTYQTPAWTFLHTRTHI